MREMSWHVCLGQHDGDAEILACDWGIEALVARYEREDGGDVSPG